MPLSTARGVYVIAPTPFLDDGRVDAASVDRMTDFFLAAGVTGITVLGQMGEAPKLEQAEALDVAGRVIRRASAPVVVGVSAPGFAAMRALARASMDAGAAGVMIAPPNTLRTDDQVAGYFRQAAEAIGLLLGRRTESGARQPVPTGKGLASSAGRLGTSRAALWVNPPRVTRTISTPRLFATWLAAASA